MHRYDDDLVLTSTGGLSETLADRVKRILESQFGFRPITNVVNNQIRHIQPYMDGEPRFKLSKNDVKEAYSGKHVYIVEYLKIFDNRLQLLTNKLDKYVQDHDIPNGELIGIMRGLSKLVQPDLENSIAPRFTSSGYNPSAIAMQLYGQISAAKMGYAKHVSVAIPKTIFEWSHHFWDIWERKDMYEMNSWEIFLNNIHSLGADSAIVLHPHAPREGLEIARNLKLNYCMIYPQTFTISSNGWIYSLEDVFEGLDVFTEEFDPISYRIRDDKDKYGHNALFISSPDKGSLFNAKIVADKHGLRCVCSEKDRHEEGIADVVKTESLEKYLDVLSQERKDGDIKIYILDDMMNTGGTTDKEASLRKTQVGEYNRQHGTNFGVKVDIVVTHMRYPLPWLVKHENVDKVTFFDSVPYKPGIEKQLPDNQKFDIIEGSAHQLAFGIALNYMAQKLHIDKERELRTGRYREITDKELVKYKGYGKSLERMRFS